MSRRVQVVIGVLLAVVLTVLFLRQADLAEVGRQIVEAEPGWLVVAVGVTFFTMLQRAWRWQSLLAPVARVRVSLLLACTLMGWTVNVVLPGRLGEVARPVLASRRSEVPAGAAIGSIVLERIFDALAVLVVLAVYLTFLPPPTGLGDEGRAMMAALRTTGVVGLLSGFAGLGGGMLLLRRPQGASRLLGRLLESLPARLAELARTFLFGLASLRDPRRVLGIFVHSLFLWVAIGSTYWFLFLAMDIRLPWYSIPSLLALLVVGVMVPTPGGVGSFHKAAQIGLVSLWGIDNELAVAYAIVSHGVAFLPTAAVGLLLLVREGVGWRSLRQLRGEEPEESVSATV
ncbi:MAG: lysylphosphatidylglycerol synthase transmembrane domain-containing protein [Acidobacteriota bacterium]